MLPLKFFSRFWKKNSIRELILESIYGFLDSHSAILFVILLQFSIFIIFHFERFRFYQESWIGPTLIWTGPQIPHWNWKSREYQKYENKIQIHFCRFCALALWSEYSVCQFKPSYLRNGLSVATGIGFIDKTQSMLTNPRHIIDIVVWFKFNFQIKNSSKNALR